MYMYEWIMTLNIVKRVIYVEPFRLKVMISLKSKVVMYPSCVNDGLKVDWLERHEIILRKIIELYS